MQIQIAFRQYNNQNYPRSLRSLEVKLHVDLYICFFQRRMKMYKYMCGCMHAWVYENLA